MGSLSGNGGKLLTEKEAGDAVGCGWGKVMVDSVDPLVSEGPSCGSFLKDGSEGRGTIGSGDSLGSSIPFQSGGFFPSYDSLNIVTLVTAPREQKFRN